MQRQRKRCDKLPRSHHSSNTLLTIAKSVEKKLKMGNHSFKGCNKNITVAKWSLLECAFIDFYKVFDHLEEAKVQHATQCNSSNIN